MLYLNSKKHKGKFVYPLNDRILCRVVKVKKRKDLIIPDNIEINYGKIIAISEKCYIQNIELYDTIYYTKNQGEYIHNGFEIEGIKYLFIGPSGILAVKNQTKFEARDGWILIKPFTDEETQKIKYNTTLSLVMKEKVSETTLQLGYAQQDYDKIKKGDVIAFITKGIEFTDEYLNKYVVAPYSYCYGVINNG